MMTEGISTACNSISLRVMGCRRETFRCLNTEAEYKTIDPISLQTIFLHDYAAHLPLCYPNDSFAKWLNPYTMVKLIREG